MVQESPAYHRTPSASSQSLAELLKGGSHLLTKGDDGIAQTALGVSKDLFELGLALESCSHVHLHPFIKSILEPPAFTTRASAKKAAAAAKDAPLPETLLPYTPLGELTVEGMEPEQVWAQLEMRNEGIGKVVREVGAGESMGDGLEAEEDEEMDSDDDEEDGSDEEMSVEEFKRMMMANGIDDEDEEGSGGDSDEDEDEEVRWRDDDEMESDSEEDDDDDEDEDEDEEDDEEDDEEEDGESDPEEGDEVEEISLGQDEDDEEEVALDAESDDDASALFGQAGPSRRPRHPTLDDQFFSIDEFNRLTEEAEAGRVSGGRLGGDDEEDEEDFDVGGLMLRGAEEDNEIMYGDFFDRPRSNPVSVKSGSGQGSNKKKKKEAKRAKRKGKGVSFGDESEEDDEMLEDEDAEMDEDEEYSMMGRVKGDLFDDEEDEEEPQNLSTHEKRQLALQKQIAELESEAIGPKDWQLLGEATSKARPENSLLEENLDFEHAGKVVPVVTEETVKTLEELIKRRIIDNQFDSPVRVRAYEPTPFLPSRYFELQDTQSSKSLAQIYEEEYQAAASGGKVIDARDEKLKKEHEEIDKIWGEICYKLDALSSLNFVPKQPKASITTLSNLPTTSMESALPPTAAANTMLAPEELFQPPTAASLVARSELTPEEAQKARGKSRKAKAANNKRLAEAVELYSKKKKSAKAEKEEAMKGLVRSGKGVTVVGKGDKEKAKATKRGAGGEERGEENSKRFKL